MTILNDEEKKIIMQLVEQRMFANVELAYSAEQHGQTATAAAHRLEAEKYKSILRNLKRAHKEVCQNCGYFVSMPEAARVWICTCCGENVERSE